MTKNRYYKEIDGLRAIAVIVVFLFHLNIPGFSGGFIGVDVFFVISGYLITQLILQELAGSKELGQIEFDYVSFYIRRTKRLAPALIITLFLSACIAVTIFYPYDLQKFSSSVMYALLGLSNIFFWNEAGYFDISSEVKPTLHTWSLSVEAQFYLVWPLLVTFFYKHITQKRLIWIWIGLGCISLMLNLFFIEDIGNVAILSGRYISSAFKNREATIFFLTPFRMYEFIMGASIVWTERHVSTLPIWCDDILCFTGLCLIFNTVLLHTSSSFSIVYALLPCLGTALVLLSAKHSRYTGSILCNPLMVSIGLMSYSLYLIHWPAIVFYKYVKSSGLTYLDKIYIVLLSVVVAWLLYQFIEKPFRRIQLNIADKKRYQFLNIFIAGFVLVISPIVMAFVYNKSKFRSFQTTNELLAKTNEVLKTKKIRDAACSFNNLKDFNMEVCIQPDPKKVNILLLGDSVAEYIWIGLAENLPKSRYNILQFSPSGCRPGMNWGETFCLESNQYIFEYITKQPIDLVVFASLGPDFHNFRDTLKYMIKMNKRALVIGQPFIFSGRLTDIISASKAKTEHDIQIAAIEGLVDTSNARQVIEKMAYEEGVKYFDIQKQLCRIVDKLSTCDFIIDNSLITADNNHLTPPASIAIFKKLAEEIVRDYP